MPGVKPVRGVSDLRTARLAGSKLAPALALPIPGPAAADSPALLLGRARPSAILDISPDEHVLAQLFQKAAAHPSP